MRRAGFTLVELSIVLVIIGLIIGGVLFGTDLARTAALRNIASQYEEAVSATNAFYLKYQGLPGDFDKASIIWGELVGACNSVASTNDLTCSGDGDWVLETTASSPGGGGNTREIFRFWQHLEAADLFPGSYTGIQGSGGTLHGVIDQNIPGTAIDGVGITAYSVAIGGTVGTNNFFPGRTNFFIYGRDAGTVGNGRAFTSADAFYIDSKMDDGEPGLGLVQAHQHSTCMTDTADRNASEYQLSDTAEDRCTILIKIPNVN